MRAAELPEPLREGRWCPACGMPMDVTTSEDPYAICLVCTSDHRYFVMPDPPEATRSAEAAALHVPVAADASPEASAAFWLGDGDARRCLNEQLAELLRRIIEILRDHRLANEPRPFGWCPLCGRRLAECDQPDIWVQRLRCSGGHEFASRGGRLSGTVAGARIGLAAEISERVVVRLASAWLEPDPALEPQLHRTIKDALSRFVTLRGRTV